MKQLAILVGEGIECEKESHLFFERTGVFESIQFVSVAKLLKNGRKETEFLKTGDFLFIPGGFSFADHFGAGRLLAYQLQESGLFNSAEEIGWNVLGVCNGFQMLCAAAKFGPQTRLLENRSQAKRFGFHNRWVSLSTGGLLAEEGLRLPVRHGEGRLFFEDALPANVQAFLYYTDPDFENGSKDSIAGLSSQVSKARYWGMMPHPEIAQMPLHDPDVVGAEFFERFRDKVLNLDGDGMKLWKMILEYGEPK